MNSLEQAYREAVKALRKVLVSMKITNADYNQIYDTYLRISLKIRKSELEEDSS